MPAQAPASARVRPTALQPRRTAGAGAGREEQGERAGHRQRGAPAQQLLARHQLLRWHREIRQHVSPVPGGKHLFSQGAMEEQA